MIKQITIVFKCNTTLNFNEMDTCAYYHPVHLHIILFLVQIIGSIKDDSKKKVKITNVPDLVSGVRKLPSQYDQGYFITTVPPDIPLVLVIS